MRNGEIISLNLTLFFFSETSKQIVMKFGMRKLEYESCWVHLNVVIMAQMEVLIYVVKIGLYFSFAKAANRNQNQGYVTRNRNLIQIYHFSTKRLKSYVIYIYIYIYISLTTCVMQFLSFSLNFIPLTVTYIISTDTAIKTQTTFRRCYFITSEHIATRLIGVCRLHATTQQISHTILNN
jgi:hypothetical protein